MADEIGSLRHLVDLDVSTTRDQQFGAPGYQHQRHAVPAWRDLLAVGRPERAYRPANHRNHRPARDAEWRAHPADLKASFAVMSGTSQATGQVSRAAAQLWFFMKKTTGSRSSNQRVNVFFWLEIASSDLDAVSRRGPRLIGTVTRPRAGVVEVCCPIDEPWRLVKQVLINTAKPMPRFKPQDVGTRFKSPALVDAQFGHFGVGQPEAMVLKVIQGGKDER